jgi:two-component system LytT family sensor kinase
MPVVANEVFNKTVRTLFKAALITSPIIAALLITPLFMVSPLIDLNIEYLMPGATFIIFLVWNCHILFIRFFPQLGWQRLAIISCLGLIGSTFLYQLVVPELEYPVWKLHVLRCINVLSINSIIYIVTNFILLEQSKKKLDVENEQLRFANLESRYQILQNQINPHFLFNSIGTAKALIRKDPSIADEYLVRLSNFLRIGFNNNPDVVSVKEELALCADYISLQQMRFDDALQFEVLIDEKYKSYLIPNVSMLTLIENAVKHNLMSEEEPLHIIVTNQLDDLIIENNIRKNLLLEHTHKTGLHNLAERYRLLFNQPIVVEDDGQIFRTIIKMNKE